MKSCEVFKRYVGLCVIWFVKNGCSFWESVFVVQRMDSHRWAGLIPLYLNLLYILHIFIPLSEWDTWQSLRWCWGLALSYLFFINYPHLFSCSHRKLIWHTQPTHKYFCGYTWPFCGPIYLWCEWWRFHVMLCWFLQACSDMSIPWLISVLMLLKISAF